MLRLVCLFLIQSDETDYYCNNNPAGPLTEPLRQRICPRVLDDETDDSALLSPWSFPPACVRSNNTLAESSKLCTYTTSNFRGEHGMSIVTKPVIAAGLSTMLQHPEIPWLEKQRGFPFLADERDLYEIKSLPGKGFGVVAKSEIPKDTVIMLELPYVVKISKSTPWDHQGGALGLMRQAAKQLPQRDQDRLLRMARQEKGYILTDIFQTNSFSISVEGVPHAALYPVIARVNHECRPNCITRFSSQTLAMEVVAHRDIQPGEEITISYIPLNMQSQQRLQKIQSWGFNCSCSFCADERKLAESDRRRDGIEAIIHGLRQPINMSREIVSLAITRLEEMAEEEGLSSQMGDILYLVADACLSADNFQLAREVGEKALKIQKRYAGVDNERSYDVMRLLEIVGALEHRT
ncbi:N-lysine methyltransferase SMYD2 [Echria macrotheca]|uniref:N-lysine methyltransferase SMYD2 n=1 Tax=Echria macrotheca TaxID=438768 RepID=A0AAJ0BN07_9PEZI|nr:N-lysine methyltransferase SMYD2 [Echria macrotheca]